MCEMTVYMICGRRVREAETIAPPSAFFFAWHHSAFAPGAVPNVRLRHHHALAEMRRKLVAARGHLAFAPHPESLSQKSYVLGMETVRKGSAGSSKENLNMSKEPYNVCFVCVCVYVRVCACTCV